MREGRRTRKTRRTEDGRGRWSKGWSTTSPRGAEPARFRHAGGPCWACRPAPSGRSWRLRRSPSPTTRRRRRRSPTRRSPRSSTSTTGPTTCRPTRSRSSSRRPGSSVVESFYDGNEELAAKLKAGVDRLRRHLPDRHVGQRALPSRGCMIPLDMSLIPNFENVTIPLMQKPPFDDESDGNKYSVPYMFGSTGVGRRTDKTSEPVTAGTSSGTHSSVTSSRCSTRRARRSAPRSCARATRPTRPTRRNSTRRPPT